MASKHKLAGNLTANQLEILLAMESLNYKACTLNELGACKYSHHYATAYSLEKKNFIEKVVEEGPLSLKAKYTITIEGKNVLDLTKILIDVYPATVMGPSGVRNELSHAQTLVSNYTVKQ